MSSVTSFWVIVGHTDAQLPDSEDRASELANEINRFIHEVRGWGEPDDVSNKVVSLLRDDWEGLQFGGKVAGCSAIWFGWNYADPEGLYSHLSDANWRNITLWWQHENDDTPTVRSL